MIRGFILSIIFFISCVADAQSNKEKRETRAARDTSQGNFVILKSGEKKAITKMTVPSAMNVSSSVTGKIEFADGEKVKFKMGEVLACQTEDGYYKLAGVNTFKRSAFGYDPELVPRITIGAIHVYRFSILVRKDNSYGREYYYFVERNDDGRLIQIESTKAAVDGVEQLVMKSQECMKMIEALHKRLSKVRFGSIEPKLLDVVEQFNKEMASGK